MKVYNAWLDLFIKLPCSGLFRGGRGEGARGEGPAFSRDLTYSVQVFAALATCPFGDAPACQGSEVGARDGGSAQQASQSPDPCRDPRAERPS